MAVLVDFAILGIIGELWRAILTTLFEKVYTYYFNFEIFILNGLQKMRNGAKIWEIRIKKNFLIL